MVRLTIDGTEVEVEPGSTVLQAAEKLGVKIPTLCHHRSLSPYGACRVCLVELETPRGSKIEASCVYPAQDGLVIRTDSERVLKTRGVMLELLLARCPEASAVQQLASDAGIREQPLPEPERGLHPVWALREGVPGEDGGRRDHLPEPRTRTAGSPRRTTGTPPYASRAVPVRPYVRWTW